MELVLTRQSETKVTVTCDDQLSHSLDLQPLRLKNEKDEEELLNDPVTYGKKLYAALFPPETLAHRALADAPERILLVITDNDVDAVPWEYTYGPYGSEDSESFLVQECHFVRGLPADQRVDAPRLDTSLHIVAVPSNPLSNELDPLDIDGEWMRLKESIEALPYAITLERARPPTIERLRHLVANQQHRVVHFMGHGGQDEKRGATLIFEQDNGDLDSVTARQFVLRVRGAVFLVTLNACFSANPGETLFSNLAAALIRQKVPYALGMRFSILDDDARAFSRTFYDDLARGTPVEEALRQARLTLANSTRPWVVGVPVLYTSLAQPAAGFTSLAGLPIIKEHQPRMGVSALPRAEGAFQGRIDELKALGTALTGDSRPPLMTIHGAGGQGKTALARETVERFGYAWPGGVWATTLESLPSRELFVSDLARFLGIDTQTVTDPDEVERQVLTHLVHRRMLIVLDNAETLVEAVEANNDEAIRLAQFLREQLPRPPVSLLATSRSFLGWTSEIGCELTGLAPVEGIKLFQQHASQREKEIDHVKAWELTERVEGHPLSLRLLGSAFNVSAISFSSFVKEHEALLLKAEDKYRDVDHRQRTLYASIDTSVRYLDADLRALLSGLWIFHAPFLAQTAVAIFDPKTDYPEGQDSPIYDRLHALWLRGLLAREITTVRDATIPLYRLLPAMRPYVEIYMPQAYEREALQVRFGAEYGRLLSFLDDELNRSAAAVYVAQQTRGDLEAGLAYFTGIEQGYYLLRWGSVLHHLINTPRGLKLTEQALEIAQGQDQKLELEALNNMAAMYDSIGQLHRALALHEQALPIRRDMGDRRGEAITLNNMAQVYYAIGQPQQALALHEQALPIRREVGDRRGEATTLDNMAQVYHGAGQLQQALALYEQVLPIRREMGDRRGEAITLNNIAAVHHVTGQLQQALALYEQSLQIAREMSDGDNEARTLGNMAELYNRMGQPARALELYGQALPIMREVGNRTYEAIILYGLAYLLMDMDRYSEALAAFEQSVTLAQQTSHRIGEVAGWVGIAVLLYQHFNRPQDAIARLEQAISILVETGLPQDAAGQTVDDLWQTLETMRRGAPLGSAVDSSAIIPAAQIQQIVNNTIAVMTLVQDQHAKWRENLVQVLQQSRNINRLEDGEFFTALLALLDEQPPALPEGHPYAPAIASIQSGITAGGPQATEDSTDVTGVIIQAVRDFVDVKDWEASRRVLETQQSLLFRPEVETLFEQNIAGAKGVGDQRSVKLLEQHLALLRECKKNSILPTFEKLAASQQGDLPFDAELIPRSIAALAGGPEQKMMHAQYLAELNSVAADKELEALLQAIQLALFGVNLSQLGQNLKGVYKEAWETIVIDVESGGIDPHLIAMIVQNTLAELGPTAEKRGEWRDTLIQLKDQALEDGEDKLVALLEAVIGLLDTDGNPAELGTNLTGIYAQAWQAIMENLPT